MQIYVSRTVLNKYECVILFLFIEFIGYLFYLNLNLKNLKTFERKLNPEIDLQGYEWYK